MHAVNEIISILEKINITKELLEVCMIFLLNILYVVILNLASSCVLNKR